MKLGSKLAMILLILVSLAHLLRIIFGVELVAGGVDVPMWVSFLGCLVPGTIAVLLSREGRTT
jgi:hypothetical protein